jgi:integrase
MVTVRLKGVFKTKAKGKTYYYAWRGGPRLVGEPGSPEFVASFQDACAPLDRLDKRRFAAWVTLYKASPEFTELAPSTQRQWQCWLDRIQDHFGGLSTRQFDRPQIRVDIKKWRDKWRDTPRTADYAKQVLSRVMSFAVSEGGLQSNPCDGIPSLYRNDRADIIWREGDLAELSKSASPQVLWAANLAVHTGLRQGDLLRLSWSHIGEFAITIKTGKSGGRRTATIPITSELRALLAKIPKRATTVLTNADGRPWKSGFSSSWNSAMRRSGLSRGKLHFHDLRGTAATNFYRADLKAREIADIMGWSEDRVERLIDRYVKRDEILLDRIRRLEQLSNENSKTDSKTSGAQ